MTEPEQGETVHVRTDALGPLSRTFRGRLALVAILKVPNLCGGCASHVITVLQSPIPGASSN